MTTLNVKFEIEDDFLQRFLKLIESLPKSEVKVNIETKFENFENIDTSHIPLISDSEQKEIIESLKKISKEDNEIDHSATRVIEI